MNFSDLGKLANVFCLFAERNAVMSSRTVQRIQKVLARAGVCTAVFTLALATHADAKPGFNPVIIRGIPSTAPVSNELQLAYLASFPNGSLEPSVDKMNAGPMVPGDPLIPGSNPTVSAAPARRSCGQHSPTARSVT